MCWHKKVNNQSNVLCNIKIQNYAIFYYFSVNFSWNFEKNHYLTWYFSILFCTLLFCWFLILLESLLSFILTPIFKHVYSMGLWLKLIFLDLLNCFLPSSSYIYTQKFSFKSKFFVLLVFFIFMIIRLEFATYYHEV